MADFTSRIEAQIRKYSDLMTIFRRIVDSHLLSALRNLIDQFFQQECNHIQHILLQTQKLSGQYLPAFNLNLNILKSNFSIICQLFIDEVSAQYIKQDPPPAPQPQPRSDQPPAHSAHSKSRGLAAPTDQSQLRVITEHTEPQDSPQNQAFRIPTDTSARSLKSHPTPLNKKTLQYLLKK